MRKVCFLKIRPFIQQKNKSRLSYKIDRKNWRLLNLKLELE